MKEIIINKAEDKKTIMLLENGILLEKYEDNQEKERLEGNIYIGKIENVLPGMQAAFVDIGERKNAFIHLKDVLPKVDETQNDIEEIMKSKDIKDIVKTGNSIMVQVKRDSNHKKGARVSTHISLVSRYFVLMPNTSFITISQKITRQDEKERIMKLVKENIPQNCGAIIRTSADGKSEETLKQDLKHIIESWSKIEDDAKKSENYPKLIYQTPGIIEKLIIDIIDQNIERITVNDEETYNQVKQIIEKMNHSVNINYKSENLLLMYDIEKQLEKMDFRKIWLKCGGFITIDKTEALTAIDVNSGKYIGNKDLENTVYTVNREASIEIAKQLRLRDIGGIVIIDYIDMKEEKHKKEIIEILEENLKKDRSKTQVVGFSKLNLLEMTRKHICSNQEED